MQTRPIGTLAVSVIGVGCTSFGRNLDQTETSRVVHAALDAGINFFDTADTYGKPPTGSETYLGTSLRNRRSQVVVATKFGRVLDDRRRGASANYVRSATEASLKRLQTDCIDLMQLHIPDPDTPIEETLGALADLKQEGKIREFGGSNFSAAQILEMSDKAAAHNLPGFVSTQSELSLLHRAPTAAVLQECKRTGLKLLPFRPLYNGLLSGKYCAGQPAPEASQIARKAIATQSEILSDANLEAVRKLTDYARSHGRTILDLAIAWLLAHDVVPSVIAGVSSPAQVASNAAAASWTMTATEKGEVNDLLDEIADSRTAIENGASGPGATALAEKSP